jgi:phosphoribosylamine---glycine ligase
MIRALILGGGGREHALAWKLSQSRWLEKLWVMPGNPGTAEFGINLPGKVTDFSLVKEMIRKHDINMLIVGPEDPLVMGISDFIKNDPELGNVDVIGPCAAGAMLEGSKAYAKVFMQKYGIPTAQYKSFKKGEMDEARTFLQTLAPPFVLKADGLAAGKGVVILQRLEDAESEIEEILERGKFGEAGSTLVIEEFLEGIEVSVFVLSDGEDYLILPEAKDYKRIGEGNRGLNTGGMGTLSPVPFFSSSLKEKVENRIIKPTLQGLKSEGILYQGFIFFGLMISDGEPHVIEYNVRLGDPEAESVLPRIESDLGEMFLAVSKKELKKHEITIAQEHAVTVMMVSGGYPGDYTKGYEIQGHDKVVGSLVFQAGTILTDGKILTAGGRVLGITSLGLTLVEALDKTYKSIEKISFEGSYFRRDIGFDVL